MFAMVSANSNLLRSSAKSAFRKKIVLPISCVVDERRQRRSVHATPKITADVTAMETPLDKKTEVIHRGRFTVMAEVTVSKIFPAGFGWQSSSIFADSVMGYSADSMAFACTTGTGDGVGVLLGHYSYFRFKKFLTGNSSINMIQELHTAVLLGSAAFCSGTAWQPLVNVLQGANLSFMGVFTGTWIGCGAMFYFGLRVGRTILPGFLQYVHEPTYENSKTDAWLSGAIGGATGFFVGTDAAYLPDQNFLVDIFGITDGTPDLTGCAIAGSSTSLGFISVQTVQNAVIPKGKCWVD